MAAQENNFGLLHQMLLHFADLANVEASSLLNLGSLHWNKFSEFINKVIKKCSCHFRELRLQQLQ